LRFQGGSERVACACYAALQVGWERRGVRSLAHDAIEASCLCQCSCKLLGGCSETRLLQHSLALNELLEVGAPRCLLSRESVKIRAASTGPLEFGR
jgi:hypothetical protein